MSHLFYDKFGTEEHKIFRFLGDDQKSVLIRVLAAEAAKNGKKVIIVSDEKDSYPIEGKVIVAGDIDLATALIQQEADDVIFLARNIENDILVPYTKANIEHLSSNLADGQLLFINEKRKKKDKHRLTDQTQTICVLSFSDLQKFFIKLFPDGKENPADDMDERLELIINELCPRLNDTAHEGDKILFVAGVSDMRDENIAIPVARMLKERFGFPVLTGDLNRYKLREI